MIKMVIFDLDGTLVDSLTDLALSVNYALKTAGLDEKPVENYKYYVGNGRDMLIRRVMGDNADNADLFELVKTEYDKHYKAHCNDNTTAYSGCSELLKSLFEKGVMTSVLSNKPDEFVAPILIKLYPDHKFTEAWGKKPEYRTKPEPDALLAIMQRHAVKPEECLYVGDSDVDVFTARKAGVKMAGVSWGFRGKDELLKAGADFVVDTADELLKYISDVNE